MGVGKELAARKIHEKSNRNAGQFLILHCTSDGENTIEEQLFGVEATATSQRKLGLFEQAHGGAIVYLEEVTELSLDIQAKLLRFLQEHSFKRVGGNQKVIVDVRVMAGSKCDVKATIQEGLFREDLYYRLNVVNLELPSLKDHLEDIPDLVSYFVDCLAKQAGVPKRSFSDSALALMRTYDWPGNINELRNVVERALILSPVANDSPVAP